MPRKIAKAVRHSSGGLRYVKALGLLVDGLAQVSMNLTNYQRTPIARVVEFIRREAGALRGRHPSQRAGRPDPAGGAGRHGRVVHPARPVRARAGAGAPAGNGCGRGCKDGRSRRRERDAFLEALAAGTPTPGGGSAAAYSAAAGAALVAMVARLTLGKKKYAAVEDEMRAVEARAEALRASLSKAVQEDAAAFQAVMAAFKLPKQTVAEQQTRAQAIEAATLLAAHVPLEVARMALEVLELASQVVTLGNLNAISDGATGAALASAALTGAGYNVRINLGSLADPGSAAAMQQMLVEIEAAAAREQKSIREQLRSRAGLDI